LFKIGKTQDLRRRLASYRTHLPVVFRIVRQYPAAKMDTLEESLHIVFQHRRVQGEWFRLTNDDLTICDNIARNFALVKLQRQVRTVPEINYSDNPLLQVMEANEKYLRDYSHIADDLKLGLSTEEIVQLHEGGISKTTIATVRRLLDYQTPNSEFLSQWFDVVSELEAGATENELLKKYGGQVNRNTIKMIKRILRNQLY
ncbi:MAG TPA: GIY-YIG nuclease family protein, partial [Puia sp.]|nr:GIY-YIG nuclease family protein [Puia sp.]